MSFPPIVANNASPDTAQVLVLLEEHGNECHGQWNAKVIDHLHKEGDLILIEGKNSPASGIHRTTLSRITCQGLRIKEWEDPKGVDLAKAKASQYSVMSQIFEVIGQDSHLQALFKKKLGISVQTAQRNIDQTLTRYILSTLPQRQQELIDAIQTHLGQYKIFVIVGYQHGDPACSNFPREVNKLLEFLNQKTSFCVFNAHRVN